MNEQYTHTRRIYLKKYTAIKYNNQLEYPIYSFVQGYWYSFVYCIIHNQEQLQMTLTKEKCTYLHSNYWNKLYIGQTGGRLKQQFKEY